MMTKNNKNPGIDMRQVKYIASIGHCPKCGSDSVKFRLPFESYLETKDKELIKVVLDFSSPQYWLKTTVTTCAKCGYTEFYSDKTGLKNIRSDGRFVLNPPVRRYVKCPSCGTTTKKGHVKCHECGANVTVQK